MERTPTLEELPLMWMLVARYNELSEPECSEVYERYEKSMDCGLSDRLALYKALRAYGHIESCLTQRTDAGAAEYDEAMAAQDLINANRS